MGVPEKNILIVGDRCRRKLFEPLSLMTGRFILVVDKNLVLPVSGKYH